MKLLEIVGRRMRERNETFSHASKKRYGKANSSSGMPQVLWLSCTKDFALKNCSKSIVSHSQIFENFRISMTHHQSYPLPPSRSSPRLYFFFILLLTERFFLRVFYVYYIFHTLFHPFYSLLGLTTHTHAV